MTNEHNLVITVYTDGGSRGNPGPAAYGYVINNDLGERICEEGKAIGVNTNNYAEYSGILAAINKASELFPPDRVVLKFYMDSEVAKKQLTGEYTIRNANLKILYTQIKAREKSFAKVEYHHIRREFNKEADRLVNLALDSLAA